MITVVEFVELIRGKVLVYRVVTASFLFMMIEVL